MMTQELIDSTFKSYPDVLNVQQVGEILGISAKTTYRLLRQNAIQSLRVGREFRIPKVHLMRYIRIFDSPHGNV